MSIFKGAAVAIITPMTETQEVNYEKLGELIEEQIAGGTDAIVICGTTGEASTLSHEEHLDAIKYTVNSNTRARHIGETTYAWGRQKTLTRNL